MSSHYADTEYTIGNTTQNTTTHAVGSDFDSVNIANKRNVVVNSIDVINITKNIAASIIISTLTYTKTAFRWVLQPQFTIVMNVTSAYYVHTPMSTGSWTFWKGMLSCWCY